MVFVDDAAAAVVASLRAGHTVFGESINIAAAETPTLEELARALAAAVSSVTSGEGSGNSISPVFDANSPALGFPSVDFGPLDCSKAHRLLGPCGWCPDF